MKSKMILKSLLIMAFVCAGFTTANAQENNYNKNFKLGIGLDLGVPTKDAYNFGLGVDGRLQYNMSEKTSLTATTGYNHIFADNDIEDVGFIPAKVGFKAFLGNQFYVNGEVGAAFGVTNDAGTSFLWSPGIGFATKHIDLSLRYEDYSDYDFGQVAFRIAYGFDL
ncbi:hypothetical protein ACG2LH_03240 [Zhouia sp. PK063]|uniref:hypothetical protein n=1 Tax=Zhouia sp. PK063 TaxID=3373602 RepID=UPI00378D282D